MKGLAEILRDIKAGIRVVDEDEERRLSTAPASPEESESPISSEFTFENFKPRKDADVSEALKEAKAMADKPEGWLILKGEKGLGKTHLATAICEVWELSPLTHVQPWQTASLLDFWRSRYDFGDFQQTFDAHCGAGRYGLDDLGAERVTEWALERLTVFLDHRYRNRLATVITTNLDEVEMAKKLNARIADRVFDVGSGLCRIVDLKGPSWRTGRAW